ncbi:MAG: biotin--[acetyl-CoA-carboxylase] ligase, partial [Muribaculaceae bacterium]|nr:biotin--[acetyl-CoA-carboxylase] ligase [Muribaculaceae bacterium]
MEQESIMTILDECASTNSAIPADAPHGHTVMARSQSAGRGQRGASWEAEPGRNVTMSVLLRPAGIDVTAQFSISMA